MSLQGIFVPLITPFKDDKVDFISYKRMIDFYLTKGISGFIPLGTTGEIPTITETEYEEIIEKTVEFTNDAVPIYVGLGGNNTKAVVSRLKIVEKYNAAGILSVSPYYSRPDQRGIYAHFKAISEATDLGIILYNIPYRTGRNIENETIYKLAELKNIIGIKDACGNISQSTELLLNKPDNFSVLTGEDAFFYTTLTLGGDGGVLASAHINTEDFVSIYNNIKNNDHQNALVLWHKLYKIIPLLFKEPNPTPLKYCLQKLGLITSDEVRLPLLSITDDLKIQLDNVLNTL
jgi:4-hydroxy-tetrahydrodipicolinate synthase